MIPGRSRLKATEPVSSRGIRRREHTNSLKEGMHDEGLELWERFRRQIGPTLLRDPHLLCGMWHSTQVSTITDRTLLAKLELRHVRDNRHHTRQVFYQRFLFPDIAQMLRLDYEADTPKFAGAFMSRSAKAGYVDKILVDVTNSYDRALEVGEALDKLCKARVPLRVLLLTADWYQSWGDQSIRAGWLPRFEAALARYCDSYQVNGVTALIVGEWLPLNLTARDKRVKGTLTLCSRAYDDHGTLIENVSVEPRDESGDTLVFRERFCLRNGEYVCGE